MNLYDLILLLSIFLLAAIFWRFRAISEQAKAHLEDYCERQQLQLISVARVKTRLASYKGKLDFQSEFSFEFSGNGENSYLGTARMAGLKLLEVDTPAYKIE